MARSERIVQYTAAELDDMLRRGEDRTNLERLRTMTEEELEASIAYDEEGEVDWSTAQPSLPDLVGVKQQVALPIDPDVVDWFKAQGAGYQTRMNAVLRSYVEAQKQAVTSSRS